MSAGTACTRRGSALLAAGLVAACGGDEAARPTDNAIAQRIADLRLDETSLDAKCGRAIETLETARGAGRETEADVGDCMVLLPLRENSALLKELRRFTPYADESMRLPLLLEQLSRGGSPADFTAAARALLDAAGYQAGAKAFDGIDPDGFWAARGALRAAALGGDRGAEEQVAALESFEFPLAERMAHRDLLRDLYFRRWPTDTLANRRLIGGFAIGWRDICNQWETGIISVQYSRGLSALLAPVKAGVPGRVVAAVPAMGKRLADGALKAVDAAPESGAAGVFQQGLLAWNDLKRSFDGAAAVASAGGRDAGIAVYQAVGHCREPRALRLSDALIGAFDHYAPLSPAMDAPAAPDATEGRP